MKNKNKNRYFGLTGAVLLSLVITGCGPKKVSDRTPTARGLVKLPTGTEVATTATSGGVKATLDPNSTSAQLISLTSGALSGVTVAFPVGSLSIPMTVSITQGTSSVTGATMLQDLGVGGNSVTSSGVPIEISSSAAVDLRSPMILAIPIPTGTGLVATTVDRSRLAVLYRVKVAEGSSTGSYTGIVPATSLGYDNGKVLFETKYFGWYSVVALENPAPAAIEVKKTYADQKSAKRFATTSDLPACTAADVDRVAYVSAPTDGQYWVYCNGSAWTSITNNPVEIIIPEPEVTSQPIRLLRQSDDSEIGRVVSAGATWKLLVEGSDGNEYLVETYLNDTTDIVATDLAGLSSSLFSSRSGDSERPSAIGFTGALCTGDAYFYSMTTPIKWANAPIFVDDGGTQAYDGWYKYLSTAEVTTPTIISYINTGNNPGFRCVVGNVLGSNSYPMQKITETLPIPGTGPWKVE